MKDKTEIGDVRCHSPSPSEDQNIGEKFEKSYENLLARLSWKSPTMASENEHDVLSRAGLNG